MQILPPINKKLQAEIAIVCNFMLIQRINIQAEMNVFSFKHKIQRGSLSTAITFIQRTEVRSGRKHNISNEYC